MYPPSRYRPPEPRSGGDSIRSALVTAVATTLVLFAAFLASAVAATAVDDPSLAAVAAAVVGFAAIVALPVGLATLARRLRDWIGGRRRRPPVRAPVRPDGCPPNC